MIRLHPQLAPIADEQDEAQRNRDLFNEKAPYIVLRIEPDRPIGNVYSLQQEKRARDIEQDEDDFVELNYLALYGASTEHDAQRLCNRLADTYSDREFIYLARDEMLPMH